MTIYSRSDKQPAARLSISYSLSYDWLVRGRPEGDWRPILKEGLEYQEAARAEWEPLDRLVFEAYRAMGLKFWDTWRAYPVKFPEAVNAFKDPLTFPMTKDWEEMFSVLVHELCHLHEDHPGNSPRYQACLDRVRADFPRENETVQFHLLTCALQRAILMRVFPDRWKRMVNRGKGHPDLNRSWQLIDALERQIDWADPWKSLAK
ncbi:MAG TPA: hypothetical protein VKT80_12035 [Chloroflexota bacterium]|nr:hypothetical protein [Chloroflexota bacterium]